MSTILAIDTSSARGSVAVGIDGHTVEEQDLDGPDGFAHILFPTIEAVLRRADLQLTAIDCFAVTSGPGAFTGLRVGLAAAKGLAEANRKPCAALSTLRVLASAGIGERRAVMLDARRGQVYAAVYDAALRLATAEAITEIHDWVVNIPECTEFIAAAELHAEIASLAPHALMTSPPARLAALLARCAGLDETAGAWADAAAVDANYVRRPDAEVAWREP